MNAADWRAHLQPDFRQRQVNEIMSAFKMHHPFACEDKLVEIEKVSQSFEHKAFAGATSQDDYFQSMFLMLLSIEDPNDWRAQLQRESRQRIVNKIKVTLQRCISSTDGLYGFRRIAEILEDRIYNTATSRSDYLRKISLKMLSVENRNQKILANSVASNPGSNSTGPSNTGDE